MKSIVKIEKDLSISRLDCELPEDTTGIAYSQSENLLLFYSTSSGRISSVNNSGEINQIVRRREIEHPIGMCCDRWGICLIQFCQDMIWNFNQSNDVGARLCGKSTFLDMSKILVKEANDFAPYGICRSDKGSIFIAYPCGNRILIIEDGKVFPSIGSGKRGFLSASKNKASMFNSPSGICIDDGSGQMFISDTGNFLIRIFKNNKEIGFLGLPNVKGEADGLGTAARFANPKIIKANKGEVVVADSNLVRSFQTSSLDVKTIYASSYNIVDLSIGSKAIYVLES